MLAAMAKSLSKNSLNTIPRIGIVGAGIGGLSLATLLSRHNVPYTIFESRGRESIGHSYGITLSRNAYDSVVKQAGNDQDADWAKFRNQTAVDRIVNGAGRGQTGEQYDCPSFVASDRDVRSSLINALQEHGGNVRWQHTLTSVTSSGTETGLQLDFDGKPSATFDIVIDAGGLRSPAFDLTFKAAPPKLLHYASYQGTRRMSDETYSAKYKRYFDDLGASNKVSYTQSDTHTFIQVQKVHLRRERPGNEDHRNVELRWVYSRPGRIDNDPLFKPERTPQEAKSIPPELFPELLQSVDGLPAGAFRTLLKNLVDEEEIQKDRVLNWHLRLRMKSPKELTAQIADVEQKVLPLGDAAHSLPIIRSNGANLAMEDASKLSTFLQDLSTPNRAAEIWTQQRYDDWFQAAVTSIQALRRCHGQEELSKDELLNVLGFWHDVDAGGKTGAKI